MVGRGLVPALARPKRVFEVQLQTRPSQLQHATHLRPGTHLNPNAARDGQHWGAITTQAQQAWFKRERPERKTHKAQTSEPQERR
eukprot:8639940-Lingulodinium_polyedra.AAC.1